MSNSGRHQQVSGCVPGPGGGGIGERCSLRDDGQRSAGAWPVPRSGSFFDKALLGAHVAFASPGRSRATRRWSRPRAGTYSVPHTLLKEMVRRLSESDLEEESSRSSDGFGDAWISSLATVTRSR